MNTRPATPHLTRIQWQPRVVSTLALILALVITRWVLGGEPNLNPSGPRPSRATAFSRIVVFGDSLSDTGNFYHLTGGVVPPPPYANGRFCNGPLWVEHFAHALGMQLAAEDNYAVAGATTGHDNSNDGLLGLEFPGLQDELVQFLASQPVDAADPEALYVVWAGANDFFVTLTGGGDPAALIRGGVANTAAAVLALRGAGARYIVVLNVPDLGVTPFGLGSGVGPVITQLSAAYDEALETTLQALSDVGVPTIRVDAFATLRAMATHPGDFGFTNVTAPFLMTGGDPDEFLFWDLVHPTTYGHAVLAEEALNRLLDYFSPRQGRVSPDAALNGLRGLVHTERRR